MPLQYQTHQIMRDWESHFFGKLENNQLDQKRKEENNKKQASIDAKSHLS